jgi:hypothetical protein
MMQVLKTTVFFAFLFLVVRYLLTGYCSNEEASKLPTITVSQVYEEIEHVAGQIAKIDGLVQYSMFVFGLGFFVIQDPETASSMLVLTTKYPPGRDERRQIVGWVKPGIKAGSASSIWVVEARVTSSNSTKKKESSPRLRMT